MGGGGKCLSLQLRQKSRNTLLPSLSTTLLPISFLTKVYTYLHSKRTAHIFRQSLQIWLASFLIEGYKLYSKDNNTSRVQVSWFNLRVFKSKIYKTQFQQMTYILGITSIPIDKNISLSLSLQVWLENFQIKAHKLPF